MKISKTLINDQKYISAKVNDHFESINFFGKLITLFISGHFKS